MSGPTTNPTTTGATSTGTTTGITTGATTSTGAGIGAAGPRITRATTADVPVLSRLITEAFADLEQNLWLVPDIHDRPHIFPAYFALHIQLGIQHGVVYTTPQRDAVAVWLPANGSLPALPDYHTRLHELAGPWADRFRTFEAALDAHHPVHTPHDYLAFLAVHPARQRWGLGTHLMRHHHRILDQQQLPAYLEAASWQSYDFYRLHGWRDHTNPYLIAPDGPAMYPMWRSPQPEHHTPR